MSKIWLLAGSAALALILAVVALRVDSPPAGERPRAEPAIRQDPAPQVQSAAIESPRSGGGEIAELRRRLDDETRARRELERQLEALEREVAELRKGVARDPASETASETAGADAGTESDGAGGRAWFDEQALVAAGMDAARARELKLFFEQLELERLRLRDRAAREGWDRAQRRDGFEALEDRENSLREQLGEDEYAAYLYAAGRPNQVEVTDVLASAPAGQAGILAGDRILRYANERIYSPRELRVATTQGEVGEPIEVEVERDGETLRFYLSRGPMGVRTGSLSIAP